MTTANGECGNSNGKGTLDREHQCNESLTKGLKVHEENLLNSQNCQAQSN
jgi:hypothetical protein